MVPSDAKVLDGNYPQPPTWVTKSLCNGIVIPAHPLALDQAGCFDSAAQRGLTHYYHAAGAGGLAVGVHTTQFEIRSSEHRLLEPVLALTAETVRELDTKTGRKTVLISGVCGKTDQAIREARLARRCGYHAGLISLAGFPTASDDELLGHCDAVAKEIPLFGFYLQPAVGGRVLGRKFWRNFVDLPNVIGIKVSPFDRYKTLDVVHAVAQAGREQNVVLYTGNDDTIVVDLLTEYAISVDGRDVRLKIAGGLLGHWACWTNAAVKLLQRCKRARIQETIPRELLTLAAQVTDCNAALFDAANGYAGCIAGIQSVLYRQGLLHSERCLNPADRLSPGQANEIERVRLAYPHLIDDDFVAAGLNHWQAE